VTRRPKRGECVDADADDGDVEDELSAKRHHGLLRQTDVAIVARAQPRSDRNHAVDLRPANRVNSDKQRTVALVPGF
jgi:hypothetical protein